MILILCLLNIMLTDHFFKIHKINMDNGYMGLGMSTIPFIGVIMDTVVYDNRQLIEEIIDWTYNK